MRLAHSNIRGDTKIKRSEMTLEVAPRITVLRLHCQSNGTILIRFFFGIGSIPSPLFVPSWSFALLMASLNGIYFFEYHRGITVDVS